MAVDQDEVHRETDEARGGSTPHIVRWILGISLVATVVLLSAIWMIGAAMQGDNEDETSVSNMVQESEEVTDSGSDIDGVVVEGADELDTGDDSDPLNLPNQPADDGGEQGGEQAGATAGAQAGASGSEQR
jgi:hypothetical protein